MSSEAHRGRAIVSRGPNKEGQWAIEDVTLRPIKDNELVVQMVASGICHTDFYFGDAEPAEPYMFYPRVLGHEGSGRVVEVGSKVTVAKPGDPVLLSFDSCQNCQLCRDQFPSYCTAFNSINFRGNECFSSDGKDQIFGSFFGQSSFASLSVVSEKSVVNAKDLIRSDDELKLFAPLGCGIQTGSGTIWNASDSGPNDEVAVIGLGGVGLSAVMAAKIKGVKSIIAIDRVPERIQLAKELGATHGIDTFGIRHMKDIIGEVQSCTDENLGPTITIDTTGIPSLVETAIDFTRTKGKIFQVGTGGMQEVKITMQPFMASGKSYIGAIEGNATPSKYVPQMIQWYREGKFPLEKFVKFYKAEDFKKGIEDMHHAADAVKPVIVW
ncbi:alcohol dehydrogenase [Rhizodiscina lignyota]|uniref:Alcohol dehydrogenase n=1 Tax=Rhizodiscina lignyota TaxID=1504668 RepID=A0A9P4MAU3_9PEZI|nr:alcohol dehydrogenase [Rhizodiscina lignyota]